MENSNMETILKNLIKKSCDGNISINVRDYLHEAEFEIRKFLQQEEEPPYWFKNWSKNNL